MKAKLSPKKTRTCCISVWACPCCRTLIPAFGDDAELVERCVKGYVSLAWLLERGYTVEDDEA